MTNRSPGRGRDSLAVLPGATVVAAFLGKGPDYVGLYNSYARPDSAFDLGLGRDGVGFQDYFDEPGAGETSLRVDLNRDVMRWRGVTSVLRGAENVGGTPNTSS